MTNEERFNAAVITAIENNTLGNLFTEEIYDKGRDRYGPIFGHYVSRSFVIDMMSNPKYYINVFNNAILPPVKSKRIGRIKISEDIYANHWNEIYILFKDFRPIKIEYHGHLQLYELWGECELFSDLMAAEAVPEYSVKLWHDDSGQLQYKFEI